MAAMVAFVGKLRSDLDYVAVMCVFFFGALFMYLSIMQGRRTAKSPDPTHVRPIVDTLAEPRERPIEGQRKAGPDAETAEGVLKVRTMKADPPATSKDITFKNKIRMNITNDTGKDIYIWVPLWESSLVQAQVDPPGSRFRMERSRGSWQRDEWVQEEDKDKPGTYRNREHACVKLKPDSTCDCYVGLMPPSEQNVDGLLKRHGTIGTFLFPVKIDGKIYEIRVPARET
jgi:hypothetical protein